MASISEPHVFSTFDNRIKGKLTNFMPVVEGPRKNIILATTGSNTVELIKKDDRRAFHSWSTKLNQPFTCPAVCNYLTGQVVAIQDLVLLQWHPDADKIEGSLKVNLPYPVRCLLPMQDSEPLLVFGSGQMELMSYCIERRYSNKQGFMELEETILWANSVILNGIIQVTLVVSNEKYDTISICFVSILPSTGERLSFQKKDISSRVTTLVSCCSQKDNATILTLWSNGEVKSHTVNSDQNILQLPRDVQWMAIETVNKSHIVVAGVNTESTESVLEVWDFKFSVKKASRMMTHCLSSENCEMKMIDEALYIASGNKILQVPLSIGASSLAIAVGKLRHCDDSSAKSTKMQWNLGGLLPVSNQAATQPNKFEDSNVNIPLASQELFSVLREKNDVAGIMDALQNFTDVPESEITQLLQYILRLEEDAFESLNIIIDDKPSLFSSKKSFILDMLLGMPYNDVFIHNSLKKLSMQETMLLLKYLHCFLENNQVDIKHHDGKLTVVKAIGWINLLLDSHFTEFLLTGTNDTSIKQVLSEIYDIATNSLHLYEDMEELEQLLHVIQNKIELPKEKHSDLYCIEILHV